MLKKKVVRQGPGAPKKPDNEKKHTLTVSLTTGENSAIIKKFGSRTTAILTTIPKQKK